jgi:hypothetical protein
VAAAEEPAEIPRKPEPNPPPTGSENASKPEASPSPTGSGNPNKPEVWSPLGSVFVDPLGFLLLGPTAGAEIGFGHFSAIAYGRWFDVGLVSRAAYATNGDKLRFSYGAGLKGCYYFKRGLAGLHVGPVLEVLTYGAVTPSFSPNHDYNYSWTRWFVVPQVEAGYRFALGRFHLGLAAFIGYKVEVSKSYVTNQFGAPPLPSSVHNVFGSGSCDLGFLF